jgi:protein-disulfide isomerase
MKRTILAIAILAAAGQGYAAGDEAAADDALIQRLESSGALDHAVERSIDRLMKKRQEAQAAAREEALRRASELGRNARAVDVHRDHIRGNPAATFSVIEYADYECPFCKRFYPEATEVLKKFDNKVSLVWRHFPLDFHGEATKMEAEAAECAARLGGNDAFWKMSDAIIANTATNGQGLAKDGNNLAALDKLAAAASLDQAAFDKCIGGHETAALISADLDDGTKAGIQGTPGVLIRNNKTGATVALPGAVPAAVLEAAIDKELAKN